MAAVPTLIAALGSWTIIPIALLKLRSKGISIQRLVVVCTDNVRTPESRENIFTFVERVFPEILMDFVVVSDVEDLHRDVDVLQSRSAIFAAAAKVAMDGENHYCIAGGRKSMSSDLQLAASFFGAKSVFHLLEHQNNDKIPSFALEIEKKLISMDIQVVDDPSRNFHMVEMPPFASSTGYEIRCLEFDEIAKSIYRSSCATSLSKNSTCWMSNAAMQNVLDLAIRTLEDISSLMMNFHSLSSPPWNSLYLLSPNHFRKLDKIPVNESTRAMVEPILMKIPKAELHCHIGGMLDVDAQMRVGSVFWSRLTTFEQEKALDWIKCNAGFLFDEAFSNRWLGDCSTPTLSSVLRAAGEIRPSVCAAILATSSRESITRLLWPLSVERVGVSMRYGFRCYEEPGELSGSAILRDRRCVDAYAREIVFFAKNNGIRILEIRCSPAKYAGNGEFGFGSQLDFILQLKSALDDASADLSENAFRARIAVILVCDRRNPADFSETIDTLAEIQDSPNLGHLRGFVVGVDVAGDENAAMDVHSISDALSGVREHSLHTTIHAGETAKGGAVWSAIHMFSADRVGHALTLLEDPANGENLVRKLKERRIVLELCPTSNREVVGYPHADGDGGNATYPLLAYLEKNLCVAICTDNPGISRTTPANEFFVASALSRRSLTLLECLRTIRNSFSGSFLPADELEAIIREVDQQILLLLSVELNSFIEQDLLQFQSG
jgi:adenosine deaminase